MAIRVSCPGCQKTIKAPDHYAGRIAKCPGCKAAIKIPEAKQEPEKKPAQEKPRPEQFTPPPQVLTPQPATPPPEAYQPPAYAPAPLPQVVVSHTVAPKKGFFASSFGSTCGCLTACFLFGTLLIGGCVFMGGFFMTEATKEIREATERAQVRREEARNVRIKAVSILDAAFEPQEDGYMRTPTYRVRVRNTGERPITSIKFNCRVMSLGRTVPLADGVLWFFPKAGIEPGETVEGDMRPSSYDSLGTVRPEGEIQLELIVEDVSFFGED